MNDLKIWMLEWEDSEGATSFIGLYSSKEKVLEFVIAQKAKDEYWGHACIFRTYSVQVDAPVVDEGSLEYTFDVEDGEHFEVFFNGWDGWSKVNHAQR